MIVYTNSSKSGMAINTNTPTSISFNGKRTTQMAHKSVMMEVEELVTMVDKDVRTSDIKLHLIPRVPAMCQRTRGRN